MFLLHFSAAGLSDRRSVDVTVPNANDHPLMQQWNHHGAPLTNTEPAIIDAPKEIRLALEVNIYFTIALLPL